MELNALFAISVHSQTQFHNEQTDRRMDRQTTCDRKSALCTIVHRAAKTSYEVSSSSYHLLAEKLEATRRWSAICREWPWTLTYQKFLLCVSSQGQDLYSYQQESLANAMVNVRQHCVVQSRWNAGNAIWRTTMFHVVASKTREITRNSNRIRPYNSSRSSKVIDLGVNGKPICDFLLVINSNFSPIWYRFRDIDA